MRALAVNSDACLPLLLPLMEAHSLLRSVHHVLTTGRLPKICKAVVIPITIDMIDLMHWPFARHIEPCQPVSVTPSAAEHDHSVAIGAHVPKPVARLSTPAAHECDEEPCLGIVRHSGEQFGMHQ